MTESPIERDFTDPVDTPDATGGQVTQYIPPKYIEQYGSQAGDAFQRDQNVKNNHTLCKRCSGTGNELFSMYRTCTDCGGTGRVTEEDK